MKNPIKYLTRDDILKFLSATELASVSTAETGVHLANGDEYLDLERPDRGVLRAGATAASIGNVLPRKGVHAETWNKILSRLEAPSGELRS